MSASAVQAIKSFRLNEIKSLPRHILRFGPLPPSDQPASAAVRLPNPFIPRRNPATGKWSAPKFSLRRQAELVKCAKECNMLSLLPPGPKAPRPSQLLSAIASEARTGFGDHTSSNTKDTKNIWADLVEWEGKVELKEVAGADIGTRLYAAKQRMFKGHKWERVKEARDRKKKILLRDMARRVKSYKAYYQKRKPDPLKPSNSLKARKLPF